MSRSRHSSINDSKHELVKGENGRFLCRFCKIEVQPPRRTFCSDKCVHEWSIRSSSSYARKHIFKRDKGVCALCGVDTEAIEDMLREAYDKPNELAEIQGAMKELGYKLFNTWQKNRPITDALSWASLWEADHIVAVVEGGGECGLDNYRTLCVPCHKAVTKELAKKRKLDRKNNDS